MVGWGILEVICPGIIMEVEKTFAFSQAESIVQRTVFHYNRNWDFSFFKQSFFTKFSVTDYIKIFLIPLYKPFDLGSDLRFYVIILEGEPLAV